ncbi:DUF2971 domain-containing protein [Curvibacter sp. CHRR-16]|uniref:DUF2971 domain-containing protein n=1 Tax=Curvibacter sp. CHRR-16 TaxID=2835872 RepID=UPI001BD93367|nr:DUF2971 domain-containing protein [Curvibacter sp. CHRR-16]MBT0570014.1 DUF2971 domain-containing protein [Curvibacter sp. CHRR-16]
MILYKYMKAEHAEKVLRDKTIQMARIDAFNDPFEGKAALTYDPDDNERYISSRENVLLDWYKWEAFVFCLTRSPLNPVMWAHYAEQHKGVVLGLKVNTPFFSSSEECVLPIQHGSIVYTKTKPFYAYEMPGTELEDFQCPEFFAYEEQERLQRLFLYKSSDWSYEEEVRVIKHRKRLTNYCPQYRNDDECIVRVPDLSVPEIYLGCRTCPEIEKELIKLAPDARLKRCRVSSRSWSLDPDMPMGL